MRNSSFLTSATLTAILVIAIVWILFWWLYRRSTKEIALVRTGLMGEKVILNGGAFVIPGLHEITQVNMGTLRLEVSRRDEQALIAKDRMRIDVTAEFYVRVGANDKAIGLAAQVLGSRTKNSESLRELLEGRFIDVLSSVAAEMTMEELHEKRSEYVQKVSAKVTEELSRNGLELESASLTSLDQTKREFFNPNNAFDAEGLTKLTEEIEERRKRRNEIEQESEIAIQQKNLESEKSRLEIVREEEYARLAQEREVAIRRAEQMSMITQENAAKKQEAEEAEIRARHEVDVANVIAEQEIESRKIAAELSIERDRLQKRRDVEQSAIEAKQTIDEARIDQQLSLAIAEQQRDIAVAEHSQKESQAVAEASLKKLNVVEAEEQVQTAKETILEERKKTVELIRAQTIADKAEVAALSAAETERKQAAEEMEATKIRTQSDAQRITKIAEAEAEAEILLARSHEIRAAIEAVARQSMNEADNSISDQQVEMKVKQAIIDALPDIIRESVKPMENIDEIKILQVDGLSGNVSGLNDRSGNPTDDVISSALRYRAQAPVVDSLIKELGLSPISGTGLAALVSKIGAPDLGADQKNNSDT
jgi:uncharacterized membrane protein YqiK